MRRSLSLSMNNPEIGDGKAPSRNPRKMIVVADSDPTLQPSEMSLSQADVMLARDQGAEKVGKEKEQLALKSLLQIFILLATVTKNFSMADILGYLGLKKSSRKKTKRRAKRQRSKSKVRSNAKTETQVPAVVPNETPFVPWRRFATGGTVAELVFFVKHIVTDFHCTHWVREIVSGRDFFKKIRRQRRNECYIALTPAELGLTKPEVIVVLTDPMILEKWSTQHLHGYVLEKCPADIALYVLDEYAQQPKNEVLIVMMDPIPEQNGAMSIFAIESDQKGKRTFSVVRCRNQKGADNPLFFNSGPNYRLLFRCVRVKGKSRTRKNHSQN